MSVIFNWESDQMENLLATCEQDEISPLILEYLPRQGKILESGCGAGRYVKYLHDLGWDIVGLEYSEQTVNMVKKHWPELKIHKGDVAHSPFCDEQFEGIISLGVIEHFVEGLKAPLTDMYRILKTGGIAIITVPCLNTIRKIKHYLWYKEITQLPRAIVHTVIKKKSGYPNRLDKNFKYVVYPTYGEFFEYRLTREQFHREIQEIGFHIIEHLPIGHIDGIYHEINPFRMIVDFCNWKFDSSEFGNLINQKLRRYPFFHCHMQAVVVYKK